MVNDQLKSKLTRIAVQQLEAGLQAKKTRTSDILDVIDLYNNQVMKVNDGMTNIPFPFLANIIDTLYSKIDNSPTCSFRIPNKSLLADKVASALEQEKSSMRAGWSRKDRAEKKLALLTGRGIAKVYASSVKNNYKSHYDVVDPLSFVADPKRGHLEDGNYHGDTSIFKTITSLETGAEIGIYDKKSVELMLTLATDESMQQSSQAQQNKFDRLRAMGMDVEGTSFAGQEGVMMTEWIMKHNDEWYYLLFDPMTQVAVRAEKLEDVFDSKRTPYVSWATNYDEFGFWSKSPADDIYPIAEAARIIMNNAIENEKRRTRPMRIVEGGTFTDVNEIIDYIPDNVIITQQGKQPNIIDIQTPEVSASLNVAQFLNGMMTEMTGVVGQGVDEKDAKVGVFYGQLQQEADRLGIINKSYSESYAEKGYRFFWGLKQHLTGSKSVEMLGKGGVRLQELKSVELKDVGDVDDVITSGGRSEQELDAIRDKQQSDVLAQLTGNPTYSQMINPEWVIRTSLMKAGFEDDTIQEALDVQGDANIELMQKADEAIAQVLEGRKDVKLVQSANIAFIQRIVDYVRDNIDYVKVNKRGEEVGIDKQMKQYHDDLLAYAEAHQKIILGNVRRMATSQIQAAQQPQSNEQVELPVPSDTEVQMASARPFESPQGTPEGTAQASQNISGLMR